MSFMPFPKLAFFRRFLFQKKLPVLLTILSIGVGVFSLVLVRYAGLLGSEAVRKEMEQVGVGSLTVSAQPLSGVPFGEEELELLSQLAPVDQAVPVSMTSGTIKAGGQGAGLSRSLECVIWGAGAGSNQIFSLTPISGRVLRQSDLTDRRRVCLVDRNTALLLYRREEILGKTLTISNREGSFQESFTVVGIVESGGSVVNSLVGELAPAFVYLPYTTLQELTGEVRFDRIALSVPEEEEIEPLMEAIPQLLSSRVSGDVTADGTAYSCENMAKQKKQLDRILQIFTSVLTCIGGISLVVAGIGVMTVMLITVRERTREIGMKKAIGAKQTDILWEFLLEAGAISGMGGCLGAGASLLVILLLPAVGIEAPALPAQFLWQPVLLSAALGVLFGGYPAAKASKLSPVEALSRD